MNILQKTAFAGVFSALSLGISLGTSSGAAMAANDLPAKVPLPPQWGATAKQQQVLKASWLLACQLSKHPCNTPEEREGYKKLAYFVDTDDGFISTVCPDTGACANLASAYLFWTEPIIGKKAIMLKQSCLPEDNALCQSSLIHNMVYALIERDKGQDAINGSCEKIQASRKEAYTVQNVFLKLATGGEFAQNPRDNFYCSPNANGTVARNP